MWLKTDAPMIGKPIGASISGVLIGALLVAGCSSVSHLKVSPAEGQSLERTAQDRAECEEYTRPTASPMKNAVTAAANTASSLLLNALRSSYPFVAPAVRPAM